MLGRLGQNNKSRKYRQNAAVPKKHGQSYTTLRIKTRNWLDQFSKTFNTLDTSHPKSLSH